MREFQPTVKAFFQKNTMIYGATETGKTVIIHDILHTLLDVIPSIVVISTTKHLNMAFEGIVPDYLYLDSFDEAKIDEIFSKQDERVKLYKTTKDLDKLFSLFKRVADSSMRTIDVQIKALFESTTESINNSELSISEKKKERRRLIALKDSRLEELYKKCIRRRRSLLLNLRLSHDDKMMIKYLDIDPNLVIVFDDVTAEFTKPFQHSNAMKRLYTMGRWMMITSIVAIHDDTNIETSVRKGVHNNIYTTPNCATSFFTNKANSFTPQDRKKYMQIISRIFNSTEDTISKYTKLIYIRNPTEGNEVVQSYLATEHEDFRFGCSALWEIAEKIKRNKLTFVN